LILCEHGSTSPEATEAMLIFASQMNADGQEVKINADSVWQPLHRNLQYEIAPYLCDVKSTRISKLIILGADTLNNDKLADFRRLEIHPEAPVYAIGNFEKPQTRISVLSRLSYVLGKDPELINLGSGTEFTDGVIPALGVSVPINNKSRNRVMLLAPNFDDERLIDGIYSFSLSRKFDTVIVTNGKSKELWQKKYGFDCSIFYYGELPSEDLSAKANICILLSDIGKNTRAKTIFNNLVVSGAAVVDSTRNNLDRKYEDFAVQGPTDISHLSSFLIQEIIPNAQGLGEISRKSKLATEVDVDRFLDRLQIKPSTLVTNKKTDGNYRILFVPTNGVGLGHAQRCSLVAAELSPSTKASFAAFPSCLPMLNRYGFDGIPLVSRSKFHADPHANDLVNYQRLCSATDNHELLVFDGGYVFDSIFRTIAKHNMRGVWIRRGLWQAGQNNSIALDREKIFERVIVPMEAFDELNHNYSRGTRLKVVGPIVQRPDPKIFDREKLRERLRQRFGRDFKHLTITMLGGALPPIEPPKFRQFVQVLINGMIP